MTTYLNQLAVCSFSLLELSHQGVATGRQHLEVDVELRQLAVTTVNHLKIDRFKQIAQALGVTWYSTVSVFPFGTSSKKHSSLPASTMRE